MTKTSYTFHTTEVDYIIPQQWQEMLGEQCLSKQISFAQRLINLGFSPKMVPRYRSYFVRFVGKPFMEFYDKQEQNTLRLDKSKQTCQERYGVSNPFSLKEFQTKAKQSTYSKYGSYCSLQNPAVKQKAMSTSILRYGGPSSLFSAEVQAKRKTTLLNRYGTIYPVENTVVSDKIKSSILKRFGCQSNNMLSKDEIREVLKVNLISPLENITSVYPGTEFKGICLSCGRTFVSHFRTGWLNSRPVPTACPFCNRASTKFERQLSGELSNITNVIPHYKPAYLNGKEFDIFLQDYNLAIEINGIFSHNSTRNLAAEVKGHHDLPKPRDYHYNKSRLAADHGITLIHIWEHEPWKSKGLAKLQQYLRHEEFLFLKNQLPDVFKLRTDFYPIPPEIKGYSIIHLEEVWYTDNSGKPLSAENPDSLRTYTSGVWLYTKNVTSI